MINISLLSCQPHHRVRRFDRSRLTTSGPDPDSLLVTRIQPETSGDVFLLSLTGAHPPKPLVTSPGYDGGATLSPDKRWLLYSSSMSGQSETYVAPYPALGRQWAISAGGGRHGRWSADGREIYYRANGKFMAVPFGGAGAEPAIGKPLALFTDSYDFGTTISLATYDTTADGRFIVTRREEGTPGLQIVANWSAEMTRVLAAGGVK